MLPQRKPIESSSIVVVGVVRNCATVLRGEIQSLRTATREFARRRFLVIESDSQDASVDCLAELRRQTPDEFEFESCGTLRNSMPLRTERIAYCRNRYLDRLEGDARFRDADYVAIADLDGVNTLLSEFSIRSNWALSDDWDATTANQLGAYYDIWALRHADWCPEDCFAHEKRLLQLFDPLDARHLAVHARQLRIAFDGPLIEVDSAFGGFGLYKRDAILSGRYVGLDPSGAEVCEHVSLHRQLRIGGRRIFINPAMINSYENEQHLERRAPNPALPYGYVPASRVLRVLAPWIPQVWVRKRLRSHAIRTWKEYGSTRSSDG